MLILLPEVLTIISWKSKVVLAKEAKKEQPAMEEENQSGKGNTSLPR